MRTQLTFYDPFHRDTSWITQEVVEDYAGALLHGNDTAELCIQKWSRNDPQKMLLLREQLVGNRRAVEQLQTELIDEYGEEYFIGKPMTKAQRVRELERRLLIEPDNKKAAELSKEIRELNGETVKPAEKGISVTVNTTPTKVVFDRANPRESERIVMSVLGALN